MCLLRRRNAPTHPFILCKGPASRVCLGVLSAVTPSPSVRWRLTPGCARANRVPIRAGNRILLSSTNEANDPPPPRKKKFRHAIYLFLFSFSICLLCSFLSVCSPWHCIAYVLIYIYIYAFSRRFYPKRLTLHSSYSFTFYQLLLSLGIEPMILALLVPCSTI